MKAFFNKVEKYINKIKRDGFLSATKKAFVRVYSDYLVRLDIRRIIKFNKHKESLETKINKIINSDNYDRIIVWRSSIGFNIPLFQRPQQLAKEFAKNRCLVFFEVTKLTDKVDFIKEYADNLYLVNYDIKNFASLFKRLLKETTKPRYLFTASTCWDLNDEVVSEYVSNGYKFLYDYLDDLSPKLAGTDKLPINVEKIHNYVINNIDNSFVLCTADILYEDMINKRKSNMNVIYVSNGVDYEHFTKINKKLEFTKDYQDILNNKKPVIGYYGALASWFDYDLIRYVANSRKDYNIVLIGSKYDTDFDKEKIYELDNVYYLGAKKYDELPSYATKFDICILPFKINSITKSTNPIKIFEYMALNKPIVSTDLNECRKYKSVLTSKTKEEFLNNIDKTIKGVSKEYLNTLKTESKENTWESKAKYIIKSLNEYESTCRDVLEQEEIVTMRDIFFKVYNQNNNVNINNYISNKINKKEKLFIITINSEICMCAMNNKEYQDIVMNKDVLLVPDSISMSYAIKKTFNKKINRYPGIELFEYILDELNKKKKTIYIFGAEEKVNNDMVSVVNKMYKNIKVVGHSHGYIDNYDIIEKQIIKLKPDCVVVALGVPMQEEFINKVYTKLNNGIFIGVGGSLDVLSGNKKRAPIFMRKTNLEWLYRIIKEPKRFKRFYNNNVKFGIKTKKGEYSK